jgi:dethiobiotin synthetase/adenosylmethionine--8-amino-7-oxononanoate aminotransferase
VHGRVSTSSSLLTRTCPLVRHAIDDALANLVSGLHIRGYDTDSVLIFQDEKYRNYTYLTKYFKERGISVTSIPRPPSPLPDKNAEFESMSSYYSGIINSGEITRMTEEAQKRNKLRIEKLESMSEEARKIVWYPFTQMQQLSSKNILSIDSAYGDHYQTYSSSTLSTVNSSNNIVSHENHLTPTFDASASWWTQGLGHGSPKLSLAAAYAAGRYGHTIFASTIHSPALSLSSHLLSHLNNPRASRVFFSDNGSTGMEVGIKMALTATAKRYGIERDKARELGVLGLKGSYHGDTIGAMDMSEEGTYNEKVHWYKGRGYWFDVPRVICKNGLWVVQSATEDSVEDVFESPKDVFDKKRDESALKQKYEDLILGKLEELRMQGMSFGALVLEPVILGAGGMILWFVLLFLSERYTNPQSSDPLFQRTLINAVRNNPQLFGAATVTPPADDKTWTGLPILADEVFTGLYRLGHFSSSSLLYSNPDISVHAKLLTGGLLPLCTTVASESIYEVFLGDEKSEALLHGHSYTGHAVGCEVARVSLESMEKMVEDGKWREFERDWNEDEKEVKEKKEENVWSIWSKEFIHRISFKEEVEGVVALGSVLAVTLKDAEGGGYKSRATETVRERLLAMSEERKEWNIHARVLGNVIYVMGSLITERESVKMIEGALEEIL